MSLIKLVHKGGSPMNTLRKAALAAVCGLALAAGVAPAHAANVGVASVPEAPVGPGPTVDNASVGNIAGLMYYCYAHNIDDDTTVRSLGRSLAKRSDVKSDAAYPAGGAGQLMVGPGQMIDLNTVDDKDIRTATCAHAAQRGIQLDDGTFMLPLQD
ncbi:MULTISPECIES: hypothetical protein [Acetobacter]|uniref:Uncharacterized protein n=7 Tax=Acetobacter TaxID=434 RepID=C7JCW4_ACEP3|nr:hypothetical protein [Acetobacter pasteurianus]BAH98567.1 hypothetical protein APA01_04160 [Acetobacter pasteurianus IFO 3283-01]BAI01618.1 hypothetical protein APA03_04160 [Acetobacter pasteurianus IFO 3283-03]BAI04666.1 hypothetical protein APA07_04160 [Acetobacter pasteurianus IFO 3283-07]BAI07713.1 hypothetical protein APA22_04160 [Acetobacter pasteurianus IFO 3283-22]BAI10761.1 hypothetical protein APA26_04160 [Acetobacter pasteurianus IFO 3283-26]BAI13809.1 hypothetical protein APA32